MTEQEPNQEKDQDQASTETPEPQSESKPEPVPEPEVTEIKRSFLYRINPLNFFRKETPNSFVKEGIKLMEQQNLALATMAFQKALSLDKNHTEAFKGLGNVYMKKGGRTNIDLALKNFKIALKINPFDDNLYGRTAKIFEKLGKLKEATLERKKMIIVKTLENDPNNSIANNNMGILLLQQEQVEQAIKHFQKSIKFNPSYDIAYRNLATTHFKIATSPNNTDKNKENLELAKGFIAKALTINKTLPSFLLHGKILVEEENFEDALEICKMAEYIDSSNKGVFALKKVILEKLNRMQEAQSAFESYQDLSQ